MDDPFNYNYVQLHDVDHGAKNAEHVDDLRNRAAVTAQRTGQEPISWDEFKHSQASHTPPDILGNILKRTAIGTWIGGILGILVAPAALLTFAVYGAVSGMIVGSFSATATKRRDALEAEYKKYLAGMEVSAGRGRAAS